MGGCSGGGWLGGSGGVEMELRRGEGVVGREWRRQEGVVLLGPCRCSRMLGPCVLPFTCAGSSFLFACAGPSLPFMQPCQVVLHRVGLLFMVVWLVVFGLWWLPSCHCCPLLSLHASLTRDGGVSLLSHVVGGAGPPLPFVWGGSSSLVVSLHCCVGLVRFRGRLWMLVGVMGHRDVWMPAGGSDYVGRDGGAHHDQQRTMNRFVIHCLAAMLLTAMWHLVSLSEKKKEGGEHLL